MSSQQPETADNGTKKATGVERLKAERDRFVALAFCWADLLFELNSSLEIVFAAGATAAFTGKDPESLRGATLSDLVAPADLSLAGQLISLARKKGRVHGETIRIKGVGGSLIPMRLAGYCLDDQSENFFLALRMSPDGVKASKKVNIDRDNKSGLFQSDGFANLAAERIRKLQDVGQFAEMTMLNLPGMGALVKKIGEDKGSTLVQTVGACLKANSVGGDTAAMVGEGQFTLVHDPDLDVGQLEQQIKGFTQEADPEGKGVDVESATIDADEALDVSEEDLAKGLLYTLNKFKESEGSGFNIKSLSANMNALVGKAVNEVNGFKMAVLKKKFDVAFQPIVDLRDGAVHHYEALCRFHNSGGDESPYRYITFAEETGLIDEFDFAMVEKVVDWLRTKPINTNRYTVAVNVSGFSVGQSSYVSKLHNLLNANAWVKDKLMFEITESSRMTDLDEANVFIQGLRTLGFEVCLDDFGAGSASFQYLSTMDVDVVKLDGSAVKNAMRAHKGQAFLTALTDLCRKLGVKTIAEMIDDVPTLKFVAECGCDYAQGYLFGKPSKNTSDFDPLPQGNIFKNPAWKGPKTN